MNHSQLLNTYSHDGPTEPVKTNASQVESCSLSLSSALVKCGRTVPLSASPGVAVVVLLVPETWCCVMTLGNKPSLRTEVTLMVVLALEATTLVVLKANFVWLK